jgi:integrase
MRTTPRLSDEPNASGFWEIRWSEKRNGAWRSMVRSTRMDDLESARLVLARFLSQRGDAPPKAAVADVIDAYLARWSKPRGNAVTDGYALRAAREALGAMPAASVMQDDVDAFCRQRAAGKWGKAKVSTSTIRREVTALQAALNWAAKRGGMLPATTFNFAKPEAGEARVLFLDPTQERLVLSRLHETSRSVALLTRMGLTYGVRLGAMMDLSFGSQVNFITGVIDFNVPGARKTRKRRPEVPMTDEIRADLEALFQQRGGHVLDRRAPKDYAAFMASLDLGWATPHVLKHSAVTLMRRQGIDWPTISAITETDEMTLRRTYSHFSMDEKLQAIRRRG